MLTFFAGISHGLKILHTCFQTGYNNVIGMDCILAWRVSHSWVGGRKSPDGIWRWTGRVTGPIMFNVWQDDRPDNEPEECMNSSSLRGDARFNDDDCNLTLNVVCETD